MKWQYTVSKQVLLSYAGLGSTPCFEHLTFGYVDIHNFRTGTNLEIPSTVLPASQSCASHWPAPVVSTRSSLPLGFLEVHFFMSFYDLGALAQMVAAFMISFILLRIPTKIFRGARKRAP